MYTLKPPDFGTRPVVLPVLSGNTDNDSRFGRRIDASRRQRRIGHRALSQCTAIYLEKRVSFDNQPNRILLSSAWRWVPRNVSSFAKFLDFNARYKKITGVIRLSSCLFQRNRPVLWNWWFWLHLSGKKTIAITVLNWSGSNCRIGARRATGSWI